jgi:hypothetical protein
MPQRDKVYWPSWRFGPKGEAQVFETEADVPAGWVDHPRKLRHPYAQPEPAAETVAEPAPEPKRRGRPPKVQEGDF